MTRYWNAFLVFCGVTALFACTFAAWSMLIPAQEADVPIAVVSSDTSEMLSREQMKKVLQLFEDRKLHFDKASVEVMRISDPS